MSRPLLAVLIAFTIASCGGAEAPIQVGGDTMQPDGVVIADGAGEVAPGADTLPGIDTLPGEVTIPPGDTIPPEDTITPLDTYPPEDTYPDAPPDALVPEGCCLTDADCMDDETAAIFVCAGQGMGDPEWAGICVAPASEAGRCWADSECPDGQECFGASLCGCMMDCDMDMLEAPGICITPGAACQAIKPSWTDEICDAASLVVWDGQACVDTCPGCCGCQGWCEHTFLTMEACQATCVDPPPPPECPIYVAALADTHYGLHTDDDGCPEVSAMTVNCEGDGDCADLADAGLPGFGETCVLGNCVWCWNDDECLPGTVCRAGRCVEHTPPDCPDPGACDEPGCWLITPSEAPCPVCTCDSTYGIACEADMDCLPFSFHPFSRCVYGRCADCRNDDDCDWGRCMQPGICYEMTPPEDMLFGTWLIGWSGGMDHFSYFRFEADGTFRRAAYEADGAWSDDIPPIWNVCDPGWPAPAPLIGTWEPEVTQSGFLVIRVRLNLPCASDQGWTIRWGVNWLEGSPWTADFDDIDGDMDLVGWKIDGAACLDDFSECPQPEDPWY